MTPRSRGIVSLLVLAALTAGACGERTGPAAGPDDGDSPVGTTAPPARPPARPSPRPVEPREGLVDPVPAAIAQAKPVGPRELLLLFYLGVEECYGLDRVDVEYGPDAVTVTVFTGRVPTAEVCIELAELVSTRVELEEPLGDREIVDGSTGEPAPRELER